jgi:hypothetical protein
MLISSNLVNASKRPHDREQEAPCLNERGAELLLLLTLDPAERKKNSAPPSKEVLDGLLKIAKDEFAVYQKRIGKVAD